MLCSCDIVYYVLTNYTNSGIDFIIVTILYVEFRYDYCVNL